MKYSLCTNKKRNNNNSEIWILIEFERFSAAENDPEEGLQVHTRSLVRITHA